MFSMGLAVFMNNTNIAIGTSITLNSNLMNKISKHSVNLEIEADNFMIEQIKKNKINTSELISFLNRQVDQNVNYFMSHPRNDERINNLRELNFKKTMNSKIFNWIKSKYSKSSDNQSFNIFFKNLEQGIFYHKSEFIHTNTYCSTVYKKGFF